MNELHPYILEFDFNTSWITNKKEIIESSKSNPEGSYFPAQSNIKEKLYKEYENIIINNFITSKPLTKSPPWVYIQNNQTKEHVFAHAVNQSTIRGVTCLNPPKKGGELQFSFHGGLYSIEMKENKIIIFPYWAFYRINRQSSITPTIYFTFDYFTETRAQIKSNKFIW